MIERCAAIGISFGLLLGTGLAPVRATTDLGPTCPPRIEATESASRPAVPAGLPDGIEVTALAACSALELPEGTEFILAIERVSLNAAVESKSRRTAGPVLYWVEVGTVAVLDNGKPLALTPGESVLIERNRLVKLRNEGSEVAKVLLVGLLPPKGQLPITASNQAPYTWTPLPEEQEQLSHEEVLVSGAGIVAREETLLFAACLNWTDPTAEMAERSYPGPVGLLVLRGDAVVNGGEHLNTGRDWLSGAFTPLRVQAGDQVPAVLIFGALAASGLSPAAIDTGASAQTGAPPLGCASPETQAEAA